MNSLNLSENDIDQLIRKYYSSPNPEDYFSISRWYDSNIINNNNDHLKCVYLFLAGANIKKRYTPITYQEHMKHIKDIRALVEEAEPMERHKRKIYLDYGSKALH